VYDDDLPNEPPSPADHFIDEGLVLRVLRPLQSGKEASVSLCLANPSTTGEELVALKAYHPLDRRDFRDEGLYRDGEWIKERRIRAALHKKTAFGREVQGAIWVNREWETLRALSDAGADVPRPIARTDDAILMTYIGDLDEAAPQLRSIRPSAETAQRLFDAILRNVERFLYRNVIHGDLSPYNVLAMDERVTVIDFPQAVDPRKNRHALALLERDVDRICTFFQRFGVRSDARRIARDLWTAWTFADLVPEELRAEIEI
jgi:RIO kinase 1